MILVDTSVWIDHLRQGDPELERCLNVGQVLVHPFVIGELALGSLRNRDVVIGALQELPMATIATDQEVMQFILLIAKRFTALALDISVHLLASARLSPGALLWTRDNRLISVSARLGLAVNSMH